MGSEEEVLGHPRQTTCLKYWPRSSCTSRIIERSVPLLCFVGSHGHLPRPSTEVAWCSWWMVQLHSVNWAFHGVTWKWNQLFSSSFSTEMPFKQMQPFEILGFLGFALFWSYFQVRSLLENTSGLIPKHIFGFFRFPVASVCVITETWKERPSAVPAFLIIEGSWIRRHGGLTESKKQWTEVGSCRMNRPHTNCTSSAAGVEDGLEGTEQLGWAKFWTKL